MYLRFKMASSWRTLAALLCSWWPLLMYADAVCVQSELDHIAQCFAERQEYVDSLHLGNDTLLSRAQWEQTCLHTRAVYACASPTLQRCHVDQTDGVEDKVRAELYVCDQLDVYLRHQQCLEDPQHVRLLNDCVHDVEHYSILYQNGTGTEEICEGREHDLTCVFMHANASCGREAADFEYQFYWLRFQGDLEFFSCTFNHMNEKSAFEPSQEGTGLVIPIAVGAGVLLVALVSVIVYLVIRRRKQPEVPPTLPPHMVITSGQPHKRQYKDNLYLSTSYDVRRVGPPYTQGGAAVQGGDGYMSMVTPAQPSHVYEELPPGY